MFKKNLCWNHFQPKNVVPEVHLWFLLLAWKRCQNRNIWKITEIYWKVQFNFLFKSRWKKFYFLVKSFRPWHYHRMTFSGSFDVYLLKSARYLIGLFPPLLLAATITMTTKKVNIKKFIGSFKDISIDHQNICLNIRSSYCMTTAFKRKSVIIYKYIINAFIAIHSNLSLNWAKHIIEGMCPFFTVSNNLLLAFCCCAIFHVERVGMLHIRGMTKGTDKQRPELHVLAFFAFSQHLMHWSV